MPAITSPGGLPVPQEGPVSPEDTRLLTEDGGPRRARSIELDERQFQRLSWALDASKAAIFKSWWKDELTYGGAWFSAPATWPTPEGLVVKVRRFIGDPTWSYLGNGLWRVNCDFEVRGATQLPQTSAPPPAGGPWLFYPEEGEGLDISRAPIHKRTYEYMPITGAPEPFVHGVGVVDSSGGSPSDNVESVTDLWIPLYSTNGIPTPGQYTWEPASGSSIEPIFSDEDPSGAVWAAGTPAPTMFVSLSSLGGPVIGWAGGVLTLYAGNNTDTGAGETTIITFLSSSFVYPPVSVYYGPLA